MLSSLTEFLSGRKLFTGKVFLSETMAREHLKKLRLAKELPNAGNLSEVEKLRRDIEELKAAQRRIVFPVDAPERKKEPEPPPMKVFSHGIPVY